MRGYPQHVTHGESCDAPPALRSRVDDYARGLRIKSLTNAAAADTTQMAAPTEKLEQLSVDAPAQDTPQEVPEAKDASETTVLSSPLDFNVVHPLTHKWTLWYTNPPSGQPNENWADLLKELVTVSSVEEFWGAFNSVPKVSELPQKGDYALFKHGVRPEWEDPVNEKGGKWVAQLRPGRDVDEKWLNVLLGLVGGTLDGDGSEENPEMVSGAFAMVRRNVLRIQLWVKDNHEKSKSVALRFKKALDLTDAQQIEFNLHSDGRSKKSITL